MPIQDFCFKNVITIKKEASVAEAAKLMKRQHIGALVVTDKTKKAVGILTDRDIVVNAIAKGKPMTTPVSALMSKSLLNVTKSEGVAKVIEKMKKREVRRAVVVDSESNPCGLISYDDLVQLLGNELNSLGSLVSRQLANEGSYRSIR